MARQELHSDAIKIEQKPDIRTDAVQGPHKKDTEAPLRDRSDIVFADSSMIGEKDMLERLAFDDEPVTIRLEPNTDPNSPTHFPIWVNGKGAEVFMNGRWIEMTYLPIGQVLTTKRKYVAVLACAKTDKVTTEVTEKESERPKNNVARFTSAIHSFSIIEDRNPRGAAWLAELRRRNF